MSGLIALLCLSCLLCDLIWVYFVVLLNCVRLGELGWLVGHWLMLDGIFVYIYLDLR